MREIGKISRFSCDVIETCVDSYPLITQWPLLWCYTYNHNEYFCWVFNVGNWRDKDVLVCLALTTLNLLYLYTERKWRLIRLLQTTDQRTLDRFQAYKSISLFPLKLGLIKKIMLLMPPKYLCHPNPGKLFLLALQHTLSLLSTSTDYNYNLCAKQ